MTEKKDIISDIQEVAKEKGEPLTTSEYNENGKYDRDIVIQKFGSWSDALEEAGVEPSPRGSRDLKISKESLKQELSKGKTMTEIAEEWGYSTVSGVSRAAGIYGIYTRNKLVENGEPRTAAFSIEEIKEAGMDTSKDIFFEKDIGDEEITLDLYYERVGEEK